MRSQYEALSDIRKDFPDVPIVALTATATSEALQDIVTALGLSDYVLLSQSFNRPNLRYTVMPKKKNFETTMVQFIKEKYLNETGIIYCGSRVRTEEVAFRLRTQNLMAKHFHAKVDDEDKKRIQQEWQNGECKIIVATIAFGMGVDKADGKRHIWGVYTTLPTNFFLQCALLYITIYPTVWTRKSSSSGTNLADLNI